MILQHEYHYALLKGYFGTAVLSVCGIGMCRAVTLGLDMRSGHSVGCHVVAYGLGAAF